MERDCGADDGERVRAREMNGRIFKFVAALLLGLFGPIAYAGTVTYVYTDPQGTPLAEADASGNITATFDYKPYGSQVLGTPKAGPGYTGHVNDPDTGFVYMQARYYDPVVGRFLSIDPDGVNAGNIFSSNRFSYANDNPIDNVDPTGRACKSGTNNSPGGCWVTDAERAAANKGDWREYYHLAGDIGGDAYARRAGEVARNDSFADAKSLKDEFKGYLTGMTNFDLRASIALNIRELSVPPDLKQQILEQSVEAIRVGLVRAHVAALDSHGATEEHPAQLTHGEIAQFHREVFGENNASPKVFGGQLWDKLGGIGRAVYDWCPSPSCRPGK
jgi:RHS repeat-associated protein